MHAHAGGGDHPRRVEGEHVTLAAGIEPDGDAAPGGLRIDRQQVVDESPRGLAHDEPVHAQRTGAHRGAQAGRAEHQPAGEPGGQLLGRPVEQRPQLGADVVVGLGVEPAGGDGSHVVGRHGSSVRNSTSGRGPTWLITSDAAIDPSRPHSPSVRSRVKPYRKPAA